ncbi:GNAT family N-acetyltransferase [Thermodesulfobacteriota bacterium]
MIRFAELKDLKSIVDIYNQSVPYRNATADLQPITPKQGVERFDLGNKHTFPIYVKEMDGRVVGWCSLFPYRDGRLALMNTAEIAYYVDYSYHRQGIASSLVKHALSDCTRINKRVLFAILLEKNKRSVKLLEKFGFERWGYLPEVAEFDGELCGHIYMGKRCTVQRK